MRRTPLLLTIACMLAVGCTPLFRPGHHPQLPSAVERALPHDIAGPPENIDIPYQAHPPVMMAERRGADIHVKSHAHWRGRTVTLYYLPASNLVHRGTRYEIKSAAGVQKIGEVAVGRDGSWEKTWYSGNEVPPHRLFFILAKSDKEEYGLVQVNTIL